MVAVKVRDLVESWEVVADPKAAVWIWNHNYGAGPGADGLLNDPIPQHPVDFLFDSLPTGLWDTVGTSHDDNPLGGGLYVMEG